MVCGVRYGVGGVRYGVWGDKLHGDTLQVSGRGHAGPLWDAAVLAGPAGNHLEQREPFSRARLAS